MRKKKMWKQVIGFSVCLMMVLVSPNVQAANNDVASMKKVEEASVKPSVKCNQKVFNGKDDVTFYFNLGSGKDKASEIKIVDVWFPADPYDDTSELYEGWEVEPNEVKIDYTKGTVTIKADLLVSIIDNAQGYGEGSRFGLGLTFNNTKSILGGELVVNTKEKPEVPWTDLTPAKPIEKPGMPWTDLTPAKPIEKPGMPWTDLTPAKPIEKPEIPWTDLTPAKPIENNHSTEQVKPNTTVSKDNISVADGNVSTAPKTSDTSDVVGLTSVGLGAFGLAVAELLRRLRK